MFYLGRANSASLWSATSLTGETLPASSEHMTMKLLYLIILLIPFFQPNVEDYRLRGKYKIQFEETETQKDGLINFKGDSFVMKIPKQKKCDGIISYGSTLSSFNYCTDEDIVIDFKSADLANDTINFQVHDRKVRVASYLHVSVNSGKLIKIK